jgi:tetratricopeptide (TPR) repeat protein
MSPYTEFVENQSYVTMPHHVHGLRARGLVAAGWVADARREIEYCQSLLPGNVDLAIGVTPELEKRNEKKLADEVFAKALAANEKVCADYPKSAGHHNNLAWLCACCRRELDKGLEHATAAVKLMPDNTGYVDTLAEVHFQRGDKDKAIELMKKCVEAEPKRSYFRKQLQRFEAGDRSAEVPAEADD